MIASFLNTFMDVCIGITGVVFTIGIMAILWPGRRPGTRRSNSDSSSHQWLNPLTWGLGSSITNDFSGGHSHGGHHHDGHCGGHHGGFDGGSHGGGHGDSGCGGHH